ncbi:beta-galactosidase [Jeotgalibacillus campisalis]|uniref:Beta-galactosidase n=1 Tax=Jeotgalibacillus campisalis TaxID=220754 RepID=A0A0C2VVG3_9BACL|nr:beta-galactosidase [Jeotgalibacillus campisalis]KIL48401.1 beta-galactosidase [Jeotgalibacillus campisalis]
MIHEKVKKVLYGGDYNPEQWPKEIWKEDMRITKLAEMDIMTVNVFSWAKLQPDEDIYDFSTLDQVMDLLAEENRYACLATSTAVHPAWMAHRYPDVLRTDFDGRRRKFGLRHNSCPNSPSYRRFAGRLVEEIAKRYHDHPALLLWHVSNEFGGDCYCSQCEEGFRIWLKNKYGSLDEVNRVWNTSFWGHTFYAWEEIVAPNNLSEHLGQYDYTAFQGISLDYRRFNSDSMLDCFKLEQDILKKWTPGINVTTNLMGTYKPIDYHKWAKEMDIVSWDSYPQAGSSPLLNSMSHDIMRGLKHGQSFMLMEQTPSVTNWHPYNELKRPGEMRLHSWQAIAHGADTVMFFQIRRSIGACEKFHGAVIDHAGHEHTRVFRECAALGNELAVLGDTLLHATTPAKAAILFDWDNWWAMELSSGPSRDLKYVEEVFKYYEAFQRCNVPVDVISVKDDLSSYQIVAAPVLYMVKAGMAKKLEDFTQSGGTFITTFFSGIVDEHDLVVTGGYPGELRPLLGIWVEEIDSLPPGKTNKVVMKEDGSDYHASILCDLLHLEGAEAVASFASDFYEGMPALTKNHFGQGHAWYAAASMDHEFMERLISSLCTSHGLKPLLGTKAPADVEVTAREKDGVTYIFLLNHSQETGTVSLDKIYTNILDGEEYEGAIDLSPFGVAVLKVSGQ